MIKVFSKIELSEEFKKKIKSSIEKYIDQKIGLEDIEFQTDNRIFMGLRIEIGSEIIDLTLNHRLQKVLEILNANV